MKTMRPLVAMLVAPLCAQAADGVDLVRMCARQDGSARHIQPVELVYAALDGAPNPVSRGVFDVNRDGVETMPERFTAIFDTKYCAKQEEGLCAKGDQGSLDDVRDLLKLMIGTTVVVERISTPSSLDMHDRPMLGDVEYGEMVQVLDENKRFFRLSCADQPVDPNAVVVEAAPKRDRFRLTGDIDSLGLPRGSRERLAAVTQAEVSYVDDREADSQTFDIAAFAGYDLSERPKRLFVPFVGFERERTKRFGPDEPGTSKTSIGLLYAAEFESSDLLGVAPLYVLDEENDSRVFGLRATWTPGALQKIHALPFDRSRDMGPFVAKMNLQLRAQVGRVVDAGDNEELQDAEDYARVGPAFKLNLWTRSAHPVLSRITADASYRHFFRLSGPSDVEWWDAGINYSIEPTDQVMLRYSYEHGKDEETLTKSKQWKLTFGIRF